MLRVGGESKAETHFTFYLSLFFFLFPCYVARGGMRRSKKTKKYSLLLNYLPPPPPPPRFDKSGKEYQAVMIYSVRPVLFDTKKKKGLEICYFLFYLFFFLYFWCYHLTTYVRMEGRRFFFI